jgi:hypothetical protein
LWRWHLAPGFLLVRSNVESEGDAPPAAIPVWALDVRSVDASTGIRILFRTIPISRC